MLIKQHNYCVGVFQIGQKERRLQYVQFEWNTSDILGSWRRLQSAAGCSYVQQSCCHKLCCVVRRTWQSSHLSFQLQSRCKPKHPWTSTSGLPVSCTVTGDQRLKQPRQHMVYRNKEFLCVYRRRGANSPQAATSHIPGRISVQQIL